MFSGSPFQPQSFAPRPRLGLTFTDLKTAWDQYAPAARTDLQDVRNELAPATTAPSTSPGPAASASSVLAPAGAPAASPTNLTTPPAYQPPPQQSSSPMTSILLAVGALALAGTGAWYFYFRKK